MSRSSAIGSVLRWIQAGTAPHPCTHFSFSLVLRNAHNSRTLAGSPLENHHAAASFAVLRRPGLDVWAPLSAEQRKSLRKTVRNENSTPPCALSFWLSLPCRVFSCAWFPVASGESNLHPVIRKYKPKTQIANASR